MSGPELSPCARLVQAGDPDRFLAAMTAPPEGRERLFALYAFNLEIARVPSVVSEPMIGEIRLQWWREAVDEIFAVGPVRRHEVVEPLAEAVRAADLPRKRLDAMIDARSWDIYEDPHADMDACLAYLEATAGNLMLLSAQALAGPIRDPGHGVLAGLGLAHGIANLLVATPELIARGRDPVPFDAQPGERNALIEGRLPQDFLRAVADLAGRGRALHRKARHHAGAVPAAARPAARAAWRAGPLLARLARHPERIGEGWATSEFRRRFALLWRVLTGGW